MKKQRLEMDKSVSNRQMREKGVMKRRVKDDTIGAIPQLEVDKSQENSEEAPDNVDCMFYPWECLSLVRINFTTLDLVIKDSTDLLSLIHFVFRKLFSPC